MKKNIYLVLFVLFVFVSCGKGINFNINEQCGETILKTTYGVIGNSYDFEITYSSDGVLYTVNPITNNITLPFTFVLEGTDKDQLFYLSVENFLVDRYIIACVDKVCSRLDGQGVIILYELQ